MVRRAMGKKYPLAGKEEEIKLLLGVVRDIEIARRYGVSRERIRQVRAKYGIKKVRATSTTILEIGKCDLYTLGFKELREKYNLENTTPNRMSISYCRSKNGINRRQDIKKFYNTIKKKVKKYLGKMGDNEIADMCGVNSITIGKWRKELRVHKSSIPRNRKGMIEYRVGKERFKAFLKEIKQDGKGKEIAERYGVSEGSVYRIKALLKKGEIA
jgi:hypothetical protein